MDLTTDDFLPIAISNLLDPKKILRHQIESFNQFIDRIPSFIEQEFKQKRSELYIPPKNKVGKLEFGLKFTQVRLTKSHIIKNGETIPLYPNSVKKSNTTYENALRADVHLWTRQYIVGNKIGELKKQPKSKHVLKNVLIGTIPILVKSKACHLYNMPDIAQREIGEDPDDAGGYFIIDGSSKTLISRKNSGKNIPVFTRNSFGVINCTFTSKPGDMYEQSKHIKIELYPDNELLISITLGRELTLVVPFYIIYYLFSITNDKSILQTIIPNFDPNNVKHQKMSSIFMQNITKNYENMKSSISDFNMFKYFNVPDVKKINVLALILARIINKLDENSYSSKYIMKNDATNIKTINEIMLRFDFNIFPHIGITKESRIEKLNYLGSLIYKIYGVRLGDATTDRNSLENTPTHNVGPGYISLIKSVFNITVTSSFTRNMHDKIRKDPNTDIVNVFNNTLAPTYLGKTLCKGIRAGSNKYINVTQRTKIVNRINTVQHDITNKMAAHSVLTSVTSDPNSMSGRSNEPLLEFRGVQPTFPGVLCMIYTVEGERAGLSRFMTVMSEITDIINSSPIVELVKKDIESLQFLHKPKSRYSPVIVNGVPLGAHPDTKMLARKYRNLRREGKIHRLASITYYPLRKGELNIYTNLGRMIRPFIIIYKRENPKDGEDLRYIKFTKKHSEMLRQKQMTLQELVDLNIIEYIATNEYRNIYVAESWNHFWKYRNSELHDFTHLDIPIGNYSLNILTVPYMQYSAGLRSAFQGKFTKQTCGYPTIAYNKIFPVSKLPVTWEIHHPIVRTITDKVYLPGGANIMVANKAGGENQEDSIIFSKSLIDRGKFTLNLYSSLNIEVGPRQTFQNPDPTRIRDAKNVDYSHLLNGIPKKGTIIRKGMAILGIVETNSETKELVDRSHYHRKNHNITIDDAIIEHNREGNAVCKIRYYSVRPVEPGDKFAARSGNKAIVCEIREDEEMPIADNGIIPEAILNLHSFPSRMLFNQILEGTAGNLATRIGSFVDATYGRKFDEERFDQIARDLGINPNGEHIMYDGKTGKKIKSRIYCCINFYQRLTKMAKDNSSAVNEPPLDIRTGQPTHGINKNGGLRVGYMEIDTYAGHGCGRALNDILFEDSDGKTIYICTKCKQIAIADSKRGIYSCVSIKCNKEGTFFYRIRSCTNTVKLFHYLAALGVKTELIPELPQFISSHPTN